MRARDHTLVLPYEAASLSLRDTADPESQNSMALNVKAPRMYTVTFRELARDPPIVTSPQMYQTLCGVLLRPEIHWLYDILTRIIRFCKS